MIEKPGLLTSQHPRDPYDPVLGVLEAEWERISKGIDAHSARPLIDTLPAATPTAKKATHPLAAYPQIRMRKKLFTSLLGMLATLLSATGYYWMIDHSSTDAILAKTNFQPINESLPKGIEALFEIGE